VISKSNRSFTFIEVLITVAILSTAIVFIFQGFSTLFSAEALSQDMSLACYLAEDQFWQIESDLTDAVPLSAEGASKLQDREFRWNYELTDAEDMGLRILKLEVTLPKKGKEKVRSLVFFTYLGADKK